MSKQLTGKELGLPDGYRLTQNTIANIEKVSINQLFGKEIVKLMLPESEIFHKVMNELYPEEILDQLEILKTKLSRREEVKSICEAHVIEFYIDGNARRLGSYNYTWKHNRTEQGIVDSTCFSNAINSLTAEEAKELEIEVPGENRMNVLLDKYFTHKIPSNINFTVDDKYVYDALSPALQEELYKFSKKIDKLAKKIQDKKELILGIANSYTSAIKLCNDAPEFIGFINDSAVLNKDGKKCTDVSTADMIAQLRK